MDHRLLLHRAIAAGGTGDLGHPLALHGLGVGLHPHDEHAAHRLLLNGRDHLLEHGVALALVLHHRIVLAVSPQADALAQLGHVVQMLHPVLVHHPEHHDPLQLAHQGRA